MYLLWRQCNKLISINLSLSDTGLSFKTALIIRSKNKYSLFVGGISQKQNAAIKR